MSTFRNSVCLICRIIYALTGFAVFFVVCSCLFKQNNESVGLIYTEAELQSIKELRNSSLNTENPPIVNQEVDYSKGKYAAWYPRAESPMMADLVTKGLLPHLVVRTGEEPLVMRGVDGIGKYGGTWIRASISKSDLEIVSSRLSYAGLVRWSPEGHPIVPHVAKSFKITDNYREYTFSLRKGMKWSDGQLFTADDILYWWEQEARNPEIPYEYERIMLFRGKEGVVEKIDDYSVRFRFTDPNPLFLEKLATEGGLVITGSPEHYLRPYHPSLGDQTKIDAKTRQLNLASEETLYHVLKSRKNLNPDHPRLWPWINIGENATPPYVFVRNPYYFAVDTEGNQLPYIDQILFDEKHRELIGVAASNGELSMQSRHLSIDQYSLLMSSRRENNYEVYHWSQGDGSLYTIFPNLNRKTHQNQPLTIKGKKLLNSRDFRRALSIGINRSEIIQSEFGFGIEPAQASPGPQSLYYEPKLYHAYTNYDPEKANDILNELNLLSRDAEGYRTYPDGSRLQLKMIYFPRGRSWSTITNSVIEDWANIGIRVIARELPWSLFFVARDTYDYDFSIGFTNAQLLPLHKPRLYVPVKGAYYAPAIANWFDKGGFYNDANMINSVDSSFGIDHPLYKALTIYDEVVVTPESETQLKKFNDILQIAADNVWTISVASAPPSLAIVKNNFRGVPKHLIDTWQFLSPGHAGIETFYFETTDELFNLEKYSGIEDGFMSSKTDIDKVNEDNILEHIKSYINIEIEYVLLLTAFTLIVYLGCSYPFVGRRVLIMIPTLLFISILVFSIIQLPPGDWISTQIAKKEQSGESADIQDIERLRTMFGLNKSLAHRYSDWIGLSWFISFSNKDRGLLQGNMGMSMETLTPVNDLIGDRILLTVIIGTATIILSWAIALPIGIFSAVRQYSILDYIITLLGFMGMCIPGFLYALIFIYFAENFLNYSATGLFSTEFSIQRYWSWGKVMDMIKHIWVPIFVLGTASTATMIRIMRGNLLDELKKPYVVTALAKGVTPLKLLIKYPVRVALNPFLSSLGVIFPQVISGGAIVAMILGLPTVGPLMLNALLSQDLYLAGSLLMVLSVLGLIGTLLSDILLLMFDPRVRMEGKINE